MHKVTALPWLLWRPVTVLAITVLAGCAPLTTTEVRTLEYVCAYGTGFLLTTAGEVAEIDMAGMRFGLRAEEGKGEATRYASSELEVHRRGDTAWVDLQGMRYRDHCRLQRGPSW